MRLLVDTDVFCKLAVGGMLENAVALFGANLSECGRLPALPHQLRRGSLRKSIGPRVCDSVIPVAEAVPIAVQASDVWLDKLTPIEAIDPGEAQIFAAAAEASLLVMTGDKRALRALKDVPGFAEALTRRIVVLEAILFALCDLLGPDELRLRLQPLTAADTMVKMCCSKGNPDPRDAFLSYYKSLAAELDPLVLWDPRQGGEA